MVWSVLNYPHARAIILGQMATVVFLASMASLWMLAKGLDGWAGVLLAVATIKPQMSFLVIPWALWWAAWRQRWRVWQGFVAAMVILVGVSFLLVPSWLMGFVEDVRNYDVVTGVAEYRSLTWIVLRHFLRLGPLAEIVGVGALSVWAAWAAWRSRNAEWDGFLWSTGLMLILTHFIAPRTATTHYAMLLVPLFAWFAMLHQRLGRGATVATVGIQVALLAGQWVVFLSTLRGNYETAAVYLPFPLLMLVSHVLARRS
jgi:hypothetical protein